MVCFPFSLRQSCSKWWMALYSSCLFRTRGSSFGKHVREAMECVAFKRCFWINDGRFQARNTDADRTYPPSR